MHLVSGRGCLCGVPGPGVGKRFFLCKRVPDEGVVVASGVEGWIGAY